MWCGGVRACVCVGVYVCVPSGLEGSSFLAFGGLYMLCSAVLYCVCRVKSFKERGILWQVCGGEPSDCNN